MHIMRYLECGWLYLKLREFLNLSNRATTGLVHQVKKILIPFFQNY
jgi:hypothetical protein